MKNILCISILAISLFLTACTSINSTKKITSAQSSVQPSAKQTTTDRCTIQNNALNRIDESFLSDPFNESNSKTDSAESSSFENSSPICSSKEIDHVLKLCTSAQESWKKGEPERSLQYLDSAYAAILEIKTDNSVINKQKEDLRFIISKRIIEIYASRKTAVKGDHDEIPVTINKYVQNEIDRLTGAEREFFIRSMARAAEYRPLIIKELRDAGLPEELSWLPLIESGFRVQAISPARALGLWQFIPSTGYKFGLKRDYYVDERMDPVKSTKAAIAYLSELHSLFGDWSTVLAAYNCGEGRVLRTIRSQNVNYLDNFWDLYEKLPQETASYVPRFLATLHIIDNLGKYGMPSQKKILPLEYQTVTVNKQLRLTDIARKISVSHTLLETLNPELKYGLLPPEEYQLRVPANSVDIFLAGIDDITPSTPVSSKSYSSHRVKRGETLFSIAKRYGISMGDLAASNNMSKKSAVSTGKLLKIPKSGISTTQYVANSNSLSNKYDSKKESPRSTGKTVSTQSEKQIRYKVKQGDTIWSIAKRNNTTPDAIKLANDISGNTLNPDQRLTIPQSADAEVASRRKETKSLDTKNIIASNSKITTELKSKRSTHWVKSGDTPFTIAQKYNMTVQRLFDLNRLSKKSRIFPGQKLLVD